MAKKERKKDIHQYNYIHCLVPENTIATSKKLISQVNNVVSKN